MRLSLLTGRRQRNVKRQNEPLVVSGSGGGGGGGAVVVRVAVVRVHEDLHAVRRPLDVRQTVQLPPAARRRQVAADYLVHRAVFLPASVTLVRCKRRENGTL